MMTSQQVVNEEGKTVDDLTAWLTRSEVANELGCSSSGVRGYERKKRLNPILDSEGTHRFNPSEVEELRAQLEDEGGSRGRASASQLAVAQTVGIAAQVQASAARSELGLARSIANSFVVPRNQLDIMLLRTIERQEKRIEKLEGELAKSWEVREAAADRTHERQIVSKTVELEERRKTMLFERAFKTFERFLVGDKGTPFLLSCNVEQLEGFAGLQDFWDPGQMKVIKEVLDQKRRESLTVVGNESEVKNGTESGK